MTNHEMLFTCKMKRHSKTRQNNESSRKKDVTLT